MQRALLPSFTFEGERYVFSKMLGKGGTGAVGLYRRQRDDRQQERQLILKVSECNNPDGLRVSTQEIRRATEAAALIGSQCQASLCELCGFDGKSLARLPLAYRWKGQCMYAIYEFFKYDLNQWLKAHPSRTSAVVTSLFRQVAAMILCLRSTGYSYNDLKPENILVSDTDRGPKITIGDLGGIDKWGDPDITITPLRLPYQNVRNVSWDSVDVLTSFLLGEVIFHLLLKPPHPDEAHPLDQLFSCLQDTPPDTCLGNISAALESQMAHGLSLKDKRISDLAALAMNLTGYRGLKVLIPDLKTLDIFKQ